MLRMVERNTIVVACTQKKRYDWSTHKFGFAGQIQQRNMEQIIVQLLQPQNNG